MQTSVKIADSLVVCPNCGSTYLHQISCEAYWREEDSSNGVKSISSVKGAEHHSNQDGNPSERRDGILIRFECEACPCEPELAIVQHKGQTLIQWYSLRTRLVTSSSAIVNLVRKIGANKVSVEETL